MRVVITGAGGFMGGHLAHFFFKNGHDVRLFTGNTDLVESYMPGANIVKVNWIDWDLTKAHLKKTDMVIHAAGMGARDCKVDPNLALKFNGFATEKLINMAADAGVSKFIYLSTAHVYANRLVGVITEETLTLNTHPYATSHLYAEQSLISSSTNLFRGVVLRLSNVVGPPMHKNVNCWSLLANDLCKQAIQNRKLVLNTSGQQHRDFVSIKYICESINYLATNEITNKPFEIINLGSGKSMSVLSFAKLIQDRCKKKFGYTPYLSLPKTNLNEKQQPLSFFSNKFNLIRNNFNELSISNEIDRLLEFCDINFK